VTGIECCKLPEAPVTVMGLGPRRGFGLGYSRDTGSTAFDQIARTEWLLMRLIDRWSKDVSDAKTDGGKGSEEYVHEVYPKASDEAKAKMRRYKVKLTALVFFLLAAAACVWVGL
jgi:hypothetical protein